jgi:hypothetical protein
VERLVPALEMALAGWETRVSTGRLNAWLTGLVAATPPPVRGGKQPKILFATQAGVRPPHFVLFASGFLEASYRRFVERRLREEFGFEGSPVQVSVRVRAKREARPGRRSAKSSRPDRRRLPSDRVPVVSPRPTLRPRMRRAARRGRGTRPRRSPASRPRRSGRVPRRAGSVPASGPPPSAG